MARAGDEGYEKTVICPYDRSHEVRIGRMQFHLKKCRENFGIHPLETCPFNSAHRVPELEMPFHTEVECPDKRNWDTFTHEMGNTVCAVKDLVPVTAGELPESEENWDDVEIQGSVLNTIRQNAETKPILRMAQCVSKGVRKNFRKEQREKFAQMESSQRDSSSTVPAGAPIPRPSSAAAWKPDSVAQVNNKFGALQVNTTSMISDFPTLPKPGKEFENVTNHFPTLQSTVKGKTGECQPKKCSSSSKFPEADEIEPLSSRVNSGANSYANASFRSNTPMSQSVSSRPSTAMSISSSCGTGNVYHVITPDDDGFCPIQVPGLGRGRKTKKN